MARIENLCWLRIIGATLFLAGVASFAWFMLGLRTGGSLEPELRASTSSTAVVKRQRRERERVGSAK